MAHVLKGENMVTVVGVAELCGVHTRCHTAVEACFFIVGQWGRRVHAAPTRVRGGDWRCYCAPIDKKRKKEIPMEWRVGLGRWTVMLGTFPANKSSEFYIN